MPRPASPLAALLLSTAAFACQGGGGSSLDAGPSLLDGAPGSSDGSVSNSCGGSVPMASGQFYLALSPSFAPEALLEFLATTEVGTSGAVATIAVSLEPLCTQADQCSLGQPIGGAFAADAATLDDSCKFTLDVTQMTIPGGANTVSGSELIANLVVSGELLSADSFCGTVDGTVAPTGASIPVDNSTFAAVRVAPGTTGDALPTPASACP